MTESSRRRDLLWLAIAALVVIASGLGLRDPWPADEPRFALLSQHMVQVGDWLFPMRGGELYSDKPPMFLWIQAAFLKLTGSLRAGFLLPSLFASLGTLWLVYDLGRRLWTHRVGLHAAWLLLFAIQFTFQAKRAQIDPTVLFMITLANYGLLRHVLRGPDWRMWTLAWFAAGLGTITKGVGALALLMLLPAGWSIWRQWRGVGPGGRDSRLLLGPLAFVGAAAIWLGPMLWAVATRGDPALHEYARTILLHQTAGRYADSWDHIEPAWYQLSVIATLWLPAALALPWAIPAWTRRLRRGDARYLLPLAWAALIVVFFSIPAGKRDVYILPALPMACLALAPLLAGIVRRRGAQWLGRAFILLLALPTLLLGASLLGLGGKIGQKLLEGREYASGDVATLAWMLLGIGAWALACLAASRGRRAAPAVAWALAGLWVLSSLVAYPVIDRYNSPRGMMADVERRVPAGDEIGLVGWREQHLMLAGRPMATFGFEKLPGLSKPWYPQWNRARDWQRAAPERRWLLASEEALPDCVDAADLVAAGRSNSRTWWLVPAAAVPQACVADGGGERHGRRGDD